MPQTIDFAIPAQEIPNDLYFSGPPTTLAEPTALVQYNNPAFAAGDWVILGASARVEGGAPILVNKSWFEFQIRQPPGPLVLADFRFKLTRLASTHALAQAFLNSRTVRLTVNTDFTEGGSDSFVFRLTRAV